MKYCVLLLLYCLLIPQSALSSGTYLAWFSDASISEGIKLNAPTDLLPADSNGTKGSCVNLTKVCAFSVPSLSDTTSGMIGFWLRPVEDGLLAKGGSDHVILESGNPAADGLQVSWDNSKGVLRFVMAGKNNAETKITACRTDISGWKANDWHHVQVAWLDFESKPLGLAIWIDSVAVASCIFGGTEFMSPPSENSISIGDSTSNAFIDELLFRGNAVEIDSGDTKNSAHSWVYRDFFRTAPYTSIQITHTPNRVKSDTWVLLDKQKQFGLMGKRLLNTSTGATKTEYLTNYDKNRSPWGEYDSKPYITWTSSDTTYATIDANGLATGQKATTRPITLEADFAGLKAAYPLEVNDWNDKPDLDLMYVERTKPDGSRYGRYDTPNWPASEEPVVSHVHYGNFGYVDAGSFTIKLELIPDSNGNFKLDADEPTTTVLTSKVDSLAAGSTGEVNFNWKWPSTPVFVRVTLDPDNAMDEICEANNQRCEKSNAKAFQWAYRKKQFDDDYNNKVVNLVGSFSDYDWYNAETDRVATLLPESVFPTTSPDGILDAIRIDKFTEWLDCPNRDDEPSLQTAPVFFDGYFDPFPWVHSSVTPMEYDTVVGHEIGHTTLGLPDLYGQCTSIDDMLLKDPDGNRYSGTSIYPITRKWDNIAMFSSAVYDHPDECGVGESTLMNGCLPWLDRFSAGLTQFTRQGRYDLSRDFWGPNKFGDWIPTKNKLQFNDLNDNPLKNARIYIYQIINTFEAYTYGNRYYPDRPKFILSTDGSGCCDFPTTTCEYWDDWYTDRNDGVVTLSTPFATAEGKAVVPCWTAGDVFLIKVVGNDSDVEFHLLPLTEFNANYFSGITTEAIYLIRTSLTSPSQLPAITPPTDPAGGKKPIAKVKFNNQIYSNNSEVTVAHGEILSFDGTVCSDPEGYSPLRYRWDSPFGRSSEAVYNIDTNKRTPGDYDIKLCVIDSVRYSKLLTIKLHVK